MTTPAPYRRHRHPTTLTFTWSVQQDVDQMELTARGTCPVCTCATTRSFGPVQPLIAKGGFLGRREQPTDALPWNTSCQCDGYHQPRPENRRGCGAMLTIDAPPAQLLQGL